MADSPRYFLYLRKSTDREDMQALSIESQRDELRAFAARHGLRLVDELEEKMSARRPGRPVFGEMIRRIAAGEANGILAWKPDRLSRNPIDGGQIVYMLDTGALRDLKFLGFWFENTPQGRQMLGTAFIQSKYYVDDLSENTRMGHRKKLRVGISPTFAPIGYLNDIKTKTWVVDETRRKAIVSVFELHATGDSTLEMDKRHLDGLGFKTRPTKFNPEGRAISRTEVAEMLHNPAYYGHFMYAGELYEGSHEPLVTKALYDKVQEAFAYHWPASPKPRKEKPYLGLLKCGECGGAITAEVQKGHIYYRCTKKSKVVACSQPYLREEALDAEIASLIGGYGLPAEIGAEMMLRVESEIAAEQTASMAVIADLRGEIARLSSQMAVLLDMTLEGEIGRDTYTFKKGQLIREKRDVEEKVAALRRGKNPWLEPLRDWITTAQQVGLIAKTGTPAERRTMAVKIFGSNLVLAGKRARGKAANPWALIPKRDLGETLVGWYDTARTHFKEAGVRSVQARGNEPPKSADSAP